MNYLNNQVNALDISQSLVLARINGIKKLIYRRDRKAAELPILQTLIRKIQHVDNLDQLRGYEGQASKQLWAYFKRNLDAKWEFTGRNRRPPKDPVNAMLSLGYTFMFGIIDSINRAIGLYPWQGALHQRHGYHHTLASDLMEPARYIVERTVLTLINKRQVQIDDFAQTESGCQMSSEARKTVLTAVLIQLTQTINSKESLLNELRDQSYRLALTCQLGQRFIPWEPKA